MLRPSSTRGLRYPLLLHMTSSARSTGSETPPRAMATSTSPGVPAGKWSPGPTEQTPRRRRRDPPVLLPFFRISPKGSYQMVVHWSLTA